ncbi:hypothetical protein Tco_0914706 [Tanacetum coccineum]
MHNNIMAVGSSDRPPMLAPGRYAQWQSRFMRYVDTKPNGEALKKCILDGPYKFSSIIIRGQPATDESPEVPERTTLETFSNLSPKNKAHYEAEKEVIHLILTGIGDDIYSTVDACKTAHDMCVAIERLQQGKSLNKQDVKTSLFWEFERLLHEMESQLSHTTPAEKGVPLQAEQANWLEETDEDIYEQELEVHYSFMAKIQEVLPADSGSDAEPLEKVQYNADYNVFANERQHSEQPESIKYTYVVEKVDSNIIPNSSNMCDNDNQDDQNAKECDDERVVHATLIANLQLDTKENKRNQKQLNKANASLSQELKECKSTLEETNRTLGESNRT